MKTNPLSSDQARFWLNALVETAEAGFIGRDLFGTIISWNKGAERLFGYKPEEILGQPISTIIPPERLAEEAAILARVRAGEPYVRIETQRLRKDGCATPVSLTSAPVPDERGRLIGVSITVRDLRAEQLAEAELLRRKAMLHSVLETMPGGLVIIDEAATIHSLSTAAERLFGYTQEEVIGRHVSMLVPSPHQESHDGYLAEFFRSGEQSVIGNGRRVIGRRKDGSVFPLELSIGEVVLPEVRLFTGFVRDLTEREDRERRLAELQAELVHVARLNELGQMVSALAHEVNQPLAALSNYLSGTRRLLQAGRRDAAEQALERAVEQATRATQIVQRLRELVRKGETDRRVEDVRKVVEEATTLALVGIPRKIDLAVQVAPDATKAVIDKVQIQQVLLNLVRNAVEAMVDCPVRKLSIGAARVADMVEISVVDTGRGVSEEIRARLFQPFATTKPEGMGVGLSVCRTIVELHGGRIWADEALAAGSAFRFTVPLPPAARRAPKCEPPL